MKTKLSLLCAASVIAISPSAFAQPAPEPVESVVVTGSRLISDITLSPTPLTVVTTDQLQANTPKDIPDALNKLPVFIGGATQRSQGNGSTNNGGNTLNLRNLGVARTLVLVDGQRVAPSNQNGTVIVDTLPQMLMSRVDVVTGGASAVYGSDAVAGVVNFILDKNFTGFKYNLNAGISKYGDGAEAQVGIAWGTDLFGGRGHYEMSARVMQQDMIPISARPYGYQGNAWVRAGSGTAAAPFTSVPFGRLFNQGQTGTIRCGTGCSLNNYTFGGGSQLVPMTHGIPTTTSGLESGGDGGFANNTGTYQSRQRTGEFFNRFSYDINDNINAYVQASWAEAGDYSIWYPMFVGGGSSQPNAFFTNNPYLSPATQQALTSAATAAKNFVPAPVFVAANNSIAPQVAANTPYFSAASYVPSIVEGRNAASQNDVYVTKGVDRSLNLSGGLTGTSYGFNWNLFYSHQESRNAVSNPNNTNNAKFLAAQDAVIAPAGTMINGVNVGGTIQCWSAIQPQFAAQYAGCVPINLFNPSQGISQAAFNYVKSNTQWALTQKLDNIGGGISGGLGFGLPAGEITGALSGEMRWRTYDMKSNALPTDYVNCTGLRMCTTNGGASPALWVQNVNAPVAVSDSVWEAAVETDIPVLKDFPLAEDLNVNIAGRYTEYSISGDAQTWKIGVNDKINSSIRVRGTMSVDIRAPNLNDLFQPVGISATGQTDLLTGGNGDTQLVTKGNANLTPEVAHTYTLGVVMTPEFLEGFNFSVDYYQTHMSNAITGISYQNAAVQQICLATAPAYNSPYCALATRPIAVGQPGYTSVANFPTQVFSQPQNSAKVQTEGWDFEADYSFDWADVWSEIPGSVTLRHLVTYQPVLEAQNLPGAAWTWTSAPKTRMTSFVNYSVGDWGLDIQNQWLSGVKKATGFVNQNYVVPRVSSYDVMDVTIRRRLDLLGGSASLYFSVQNIGNTRAPLNPTNASNPGLFYPTQGYYSDMGRFFTIGLRGNL